MIADVLAYIKLSESGDLGQCSVEALSSKQCPKQAGESTAFFLRPHSTGFLSQHPLLFTTLPVIL